MTNYLILRGSGGGGDSGSWRVPDTDHPTLDLVMKTIDRCRTGHGFVRLSRVDGHEPNEPELELHSEDGRYMVLMLVMHADDTDEVLSLNNENTPEDPEELDRFRSFRGELFPEQTVVTDFDLVRRTFKEFMETGTVSSELMPR